MVKVKLKTHKGAKKRIIKTGSGKYKHKHSNVVHILTKKSAKRKQSLSGLTIVRGCDHNRIDQMLPNS